MNLKNKKVLNRRPAMVGMAIAAFVAFGLVLPGTHAADNWTGATNATWDTTTNWSLGHAPTSGDLANFPGVVPGSGSTITLSTGELADSLAFANSYTLTGGTLAFTTGNVSVSSGSTATINSQITGATTSI